MTVAKVMSWMSFWGWTNGGQPGSVKVNADGKTIAVHGDGVWSADVTSAQIRVERDSFGDKLMDEIERDIEHR